MGMSEEAALDYLENVKDGNPWKYIKDRKIQFSRDSLERAVKEMSLED